MQKINLIYKVNMTNAITETQRPDVGIAVTPRAQLADKVKFLAGSYPVSAAFLESIRRQVEAAIPTLNPHLAYTLEKICGKAFWARLDNGERKLAGRCMAHLVIKNEFPLAFVPGKHEYPKYYQLK